MKYVLIGERNGIRIKEFFELNKENSKEFNDNPKIMYSTGVKKLKNKIRRKYKTNKVVGKEKYFEWSLSSLKR